MKHISIKRQNFARKGNQAATLLASLLAVLGLASAFWNWKTFSCAFILIAFFYITQKYSLKYSFNKNVLFVGTITLAYVTSINYFWQISILETLFTAILLSFIFLAKKSWKESKTESEFEIFMMNEQYLKCLVTKSNDYKGYALHPEGYAKWYEIKDINSLNFSEKYLTVNLKNQTIHPRELNKDDLKLIREYCELNFQSLLKEK